MITNLNTMAKTFTKITKTFARLSVTIIVKGRILVLILHLEAKYTKMDCKNEIYAKKMGKEHLDYKSQLWQKKSIVNLGQSQLWKSTVNAVKSTDDVSRLTGR